MGDRRAGEGDREEVLARLLHPLLDGGRHLLGLSVAQPDVAVAVAHHDERGEREPPAAFHDLGDPVDRDHALFELPFRHQSSSPASRAPSARPATRPWNLNPPRSNTTLVIPADLARSPTSLPTAFAASTSPVRPERSPDSVVDAVASVRPCTSSITW